MSVVNSVKNWEILEKSDEKFLSKSLNKNDLLVISNLNFDLSFILLYFAKE